MTTAYEIRMWNEYLYNWLVVVYESVKKYRSSLPNFMETRVLEKRYQLTILQTYEGKVCLEISNYENKFKKTVDLSNKPKWNWKRPCVKKEKD